jgi:predicted unusual protein kinase regulating ubiquinone biosynthesis (AarF/ABC1/UbiB family)
MARLSLIKVMAGILLLLAWLSDASNLKAGTGVEARFGRRFFLSMSSQSVSGSSSNSARVDRARLRLAEVQGLLPIGASEKAELTGTSLSEMMKQATSIDSSTRVREISWRVAEPEIRYDAMRSQTELYSQPLRWLSRNVELFVPFSIFTLNVVFDILTGTEKQRRANRAEELLDVISKQSPAIIKAGQALASRPDLFPKEYLEALQKLQDRCPAYPTNQAIAQFESEIGVPFDEVFEYESPLEPAAAASIGQVYKAKLKSNGAEVAIKIQRPNCMNTISTDLFVLRWYSNLVERLLKLVGRNISLVSVIDDFGELIFREMDYRAEAVNAQRFAELYASIPDVFVPKVYTDLSTGKVLTMEWVTGARLSDKSSLERMGLDSSKFVDILVQCSLRQMLENGFFHADPHAGNLLAMPSGKLCFLDFGMVSYVESQQRYSIIEAVVHLVNRDFVALANLYSRMGFIPADVNQEPLVQALRKALPDVLNASVGELNIKNIINKLGDVMFRFPFSLPPYYISIIRCLGVLEGVALQVDDNFRIIEDAYPYIASRLLTDSAEELQEALQQLLFTKEDEPRWDRLEELLERADSVTDYSIEEAAERLIAYLAIDTEPSARLREVIKTQIIENSSVFFEGGAFLASSQIRNGELLGTMTSLASKAREGGSGAAITELIDLLEKNYESSLLSGEFAAVNGAMSSNDHHQASSKPPSASRVAALLLSGGDDPRKAQEVVVGILRKMLREPKMAALTSEIVAEVVEKNSARVLEILLVG